MAWEEGRVAKGVWVFSLGWRGGLGLWGGIENQPAGALEVGVSDAVIDGAHFRATVEGGCRGGNVKGYLKSDDYVEEGNVAGTSKILYSCLLCIKWGDM